MVVLRGKYIVQTLIGKTKRGLVPRVLWLIRGGLIDGRLIQVLLSNLVSAWRKTKKNSNKKTKPWLLIAIFAHTLQWSFLQYADAYRTRYLWRSIWESPWFVSFHLTMSYVYLVNYRGWAGWGPMLSIIEYELSSLASSACNVHWVVFLDKIFYSGFLLARFSPDRDCKRVQANCKDHFSKCQRDKPAG